MNSRITIPMINAMSREDFIAQFGGIFEHSPWVAERAVVRRPFASLDDMLEAMSASVNTASDHEKLTLIRAHPDLVGRAADHAETLTRESAGEQVAAGLMELSADEIAAFRQFNQQYAARFGFPFVICARENKKDAILAAFPLRLKNSTEQEQATALAEIHKIARLRLLDCVEN